MCRFVAYLGEDILLKDVLVDPMYSLVKQSLYAQESLVRTNGDGFGIGWYVPQISPDPALYVSVLPAWNDMNLLYLTSKTKATCFFGHVRAANFGTVSNYNCHPFIYKQWMFMHNGFVTDFICIKRALCNLLDEDIYSWIKGQTDSEHVFALFIQLARDKDLSHLSIVADVLEATFNTIKQLLINAGKQDQSYLNICITDGKQLVASRYCVDRSQEPDSLHYLISTDQSSGLQQSALIASEMLTEKKQWLRVPPSHFVCVDENHKVELRGIGMNKKEAGLQATQPGD
ncbi:MAG: class II glutamine amidotransferase [Legionella sp.]|nr:class II glutamine amidotransferase [Legionella sp.]